MLESVILISLSTYGLAYTFTHLDGPADIFLKLQKLKLFQCFYCTAAWIATLVSLLHTQVLIEWAILSLATIGATYIIYEVANPL